MAPALSTPRHSTFLPALACSLLVAACPGPGSPEHDTDTAAPGDSETTGTSAPGETASEAPTTGPVTGDTGAVTTSEGPGSTTGHVPPDSTTDATTGTTEPEFGNCPYAPPGVDVTLERDEQGVVTDLSTRPCGSEQQLVGLQVIAAGDDHLQAAVCGDSVCGACDVADTITLSLAIPGDFPGLPAHLAAGDCVQLGLDWQRPGDDPQACALSGLALSRMRRGAPEPVPTFMYRYTEALPRADVLGPFSLTGVLHGPGAITCPCDGDCCGDEPGSRRLRFIAALYGAEIEGPPVDPGATVPLFAFGTPEGDDLFGDLALVRAYVPGDCSAPARYEWLLHVAPG